MIGYSFTSDLMKERHFLSLSCVAYRIVDAELITFQHSNTITLLQGSKLMLANSKNASYFDNLQVRENINKQTLAS